MSKSDGIALSSASELVKVERGFKKGNKFDGFAKSRIY